MKVSRKLTILALVVGMMGALLATAGIAVGQNGDHPVYVDRGVLLLNTKNNSEFSVTWHDESGTVKGTQTLAVDNKCNVLTPTGPNLIAITQTGGTFGLTKVGAVSHGLGVKTKNNCSTEQGQIAVGQTLTLALGSAFDDTFFIKSAEIDVEGKRNARLGVTYLPQDEYEVVFLNRTSSDNGPDSGTGDNSIAPLGSGVAPFRGVQFKPVANGSNDPAVSIEGGGDGTLAGGALRTSLGTNDSVFELVQVFDGVLACGGRVSESDGFVTGTFWRIGDAGEGGDPDCAEIKPYNLTVTADTGGGTVTFSPEGAVTARYEAEELAFAPYPAGNPVPQTLRYDDEDGGGYRDMQWCRTVEFSTDGRVASATLPSSPADPTPTWCIVSSQTDVFGIDGDIQTTWRAYGEGDPRFSGA